MCEAWLHNFEAFYDWAVSNGYKDDLTIDRIDSDGDYCPENCRWASQTEQIRNRSNSCKVAIDGEVKSLYEWAEQYGLEYQTVYRRYKRGLTGKDLVKQRR